MKTNKKKRLSTLLIDDEKQLLTLNELVLNSDFNIFKASNITQALDTLTSQEIHIIISDHFIGPENGLNFLVELHKTRPDIIKIIFSSCTCHEVIIQSHNSKAIFRYLTKPCSNQDLLENTRLAALTWEIACYEKEIKNEHLNLKETITSIDLLETKSKMKIKHLTLLGSQTAKVIISLGIGIILTGSLSLFILYCIKSLLGFDIFK